MINTEEMVIQTTPEAAPSPFKLGTVAALFANNTAQVLFDGETTASEKQYAYLSTYVPEVDDRVLLVNVGGTYIIMGDISYNVSPSGDISKLEEDVTALQGAMSVVQEDVLGVQNSISTIESEITTINGTLEMKIGSDMDSDVNGDRNIDYMYVDPTTKRLIVRRKNGLWTAYSNVL